MIDLGLGCCVLLDQLRIPDELGLGVGERRLSRKQLGLGLLQLVLVLVLLNREQKITLLDELPILVMDLVKIALDPRDQLDRIH